MSDLSSPLNHTSAFSKYLFLMFLMFSGVLQAQNTVPLLENKAKSIDAVHVAPVTLEPFGASFMSAVQPTPDQAKVLIYRQGQGVKTGPANLYIDRRYHTSLLPGGFSEFCTVLGQARLMAVLNDAQSLHKGKQTDGLAWSFQAGHTLYLKVEESGQIVEVMSAQALQELKSTARQIHTLSRSPAVQECKALPPQPLPVVAPLVAAPPVLATVQPEVVPVKVSAPIKPTVPRLYALESDALFDFGKTQLRAKGYNEIELMAQKLRQDFTQVERIRVIGHSDAIGQSKANRKLSMARAQVVADQLKERGIRPNKGFQMEGEGPRHLIKVTCGNAATPANKLCHAPNRRVDIVVTGAKR